MDLCLDQAADWEGGGRLTVDLTQLLDNWRRLKERAGGAEVAGVVKADAYGLGLEGIAAALAGAGCRTFFVAIPAEGLRLRAIAPDAVIYVLNGLAPGAAAAYGRARLRPVLGSPAEVAEWSSYRAAGGKALAALQIDTGLNRLGLTPAEAGPLAGRAAALGITLVMSHLACADQPDHPLNAAQLSAFRAVTRLFPGIPASFANSAALYLPADYHFDLVRPGIALYGGAFRAAYPVLGAVAIAEARIAQIRCVAAGEPIGYGAKDHLDRAGRIAILSAGYADGYHRRAGSSRARAGASVHLHGREAPLVGRISMDLMAVDVTDIPEARRGDFAELFGPNIALDSVADRADTIGYELLTAIGRRYRRHYRGGA